MELYEGNRTALLREYISRESSMEKEAILGTVLPAAGRGLWGLARGADTAIKSTGKLLINPKHSKILTKGLQHSNPYVKKTTQFAVDQVLPRIAGGTVALGGVVGARSLWNSFQEGRQGAKQNAAPSNQGNFTNTGLRPQF